MSKTKNKKLPAGQAGIKTFSQHLDKRYGKIGSEKRTEFEIKAKSFAIGEFLSLKSLCSFGNNGERNG